MSYHIDDLHPPDDRIPLSVNFKGRSLSALFDATTIAKNQAEEPLDANEEQPKAGEEEAKEDQMEEEEEEDEGAVEPMDTEVRNNKSASDGTKVIAQKRRDGPMFTRQKLDLESSLDVDCIKKCLYGATAMLKYSTRGETTKMRKTHRLLLLLRHLERGAEEGIRCF